MATIGGALTALVTPFTADGTAVDLRRLVEQIEFQADGGVTGIVPCGTTGESPTLDPSEHRAVVETAVRQGRARGLQVVAGAGSNDTRHAVALHRLARDCGADAALHVCPYYNRPSPEGLYRHFMTVADACDLPVVLYNIPGRCGVGLTIRTIERLAAHPHVQAIKEASGSLALVSRIVERTDLAVLSGDDPMTLPLMSLGAVGVISVLSNLLPRAVASLVESVEAGDLAQARSIHGRLAPIASALLELDSNPVPIKSALRLVGRDSGAVRLPLVPARQQAVETIEALLRSCPMLPALQPT
jgi:4-hydroxy-tetrahydrodipicolinate synthase